MKSRIAPIIGIILFLASAWSIYKKQTPKSEYDLDAFGSVPVLMNGRIQPLDSVARNSLLLMQGKRTTRDSEGNRRQAIEWMTQLMMMPEEASKQPVFRIYDEDIRSYATKETSKPEPEGVAGVLLGSGSDHFYYSYDELRPHFDTISRQANEAAKVESQLRSRFQKAVINLANAITIHNQLRFSLHHGGTPSFTQEIEQLEAFAPRGMAAINARQAGQPFDEGDYRSMLDIGFTYQNFEQSSRFFSLVENSPEGEPRWLKMGEILGMALRNGEISQQAKRYAEAIDAYRGGDANAFNEAVYGLLAEIEAVSPELVQKGSAEQTFNYAAPFYVSMVGYVMVFLAAVISWIRWPDTMGRTALWLVIACFIIHTIGILTRMYLEGRPPVTNLYSSAIFVGWGATLLAIVLEFLYRNSIGSVTAAMIGFSTLIVAHHLSASGDTLEMLRAVLDSNFWLATHVIIITLGYSSTFLSGFLAIVFVLMGVFTNRIDKPSAKALQAMVYGIVCFSTLFSFVGTVLGGIWADQSWGRFWGWDPKENGAMLLVLWNAIILHARWGGYIKERGLMMLAIGGNIVTSWSWFGTNMLGIGLHSYGFMDKAFAYLMGFVLLNLLVIALAAFPQERWRSQYR